MRGWRAKVLVLLGSVVLALGIGAAAGEVALRYHERTRESVPGTMPGLYYPHARLRYALVRGGSYYHWAHVNRQGFRGTREVALEKPQGVLRLMAVGGSTTFETTVSGDERAWPARLEHYLAELAPQCRIEVINAGVPGYRVLDNLIRLQTDLHRYQPDLIISYEVHNDLYAALEASRAPAAADPAMPDAAPALTPWGHWLARNSLLYQKGEAVRKALAHRRRPRGQESAGQTQQRMTTAFAQGAEQFERDLNSFVLVAQGLGIPVVLPEVGQVSGAGAVSESDPEILAVWNAVYPATDIGIVLQGYARYNDAVRTVAARNGATFLPAVDFGLRGPEWYAPYDPIHTSDRGADRMGHRLAEALLASGTIGRLEHAADACQVSPGTVAGR